MSSLIFFAVALTLKIGNITDYSKVDTITHMLLWILSIINLAMYLLLFLFPESVYGIFSFKKPVMPKIENLNNLDFQHSNNIVFLKCVAFLIVHLCFPKLFCIEGQFQDLFFHLRL